MSDHEGSIEVLRLFDTLRLLGVTRSDVSSALSNPSKQKELAEVLHTGPTAIKQTYPLIAKAFESDPLVRNALHRKGLHDMRELGLVTHEQLSLSRGFGPRIMNTVTETMVLYGLTFLQQSSRRAEVAKTIYNDIRDVPSWVIQTPGYLGYIHIGDDRFSRHGMKTIGMIADMSRKMLSEIEEFPPGVLDTYALMLAAYGLSFKPS